MSDYQLPPDLLAEYHRLVDADHAGTLTDAGRKQLEETRRLLDHEHMRQPALMRADARARARHEAAVADLQAQLLYLERLLERAGDE